MSQIEKHGVIFAIVQNDLLEIEKRIKAKRFTDYYFVPGGGVEDGESVPVGCFREIIEEYGVIAKRIKEIGEITVADDKGISRKSHIFFVKEWAGELSNPEQKSKHISVPISEARTLCKHPDTQRILDIIDEELSTQNR